MSAADWTTADEVRAYREWAGCGVMDAKKLLTGRALRKLLSGSPSPHDMRRALLQIVDDYYPDDPEGPY